MKNNLLTITFLFYSILSFSQEKKDLDILTTDSSWSKEVFHFPLGFAKEIHYEGTEDARFPRGWSKQNHPNFWSYVFAGHQS